VALMVDEGDVDVPIVYAHCDEAEHVDVLVAVLDAQA
jgi:hypothetical protein